MKFVNLREENNFLNNVKIDMKIASCSFHVKFI